MADKVWTHSMDGSDAEVDLAQVVRGRPRVDGWEDQFSIAEEPDAWGHIVWQHGPIQEVARNGILLEELLEFVVIERLRGFNRDQIQNPENTRTPELIPNPFRNRETSLAITHLEEALNWLKRRSELRRRQGVEGTFHPHKS